MPQPVPEQVEIPSPAGDARTSLLGFQWAITIAQSLKPVFYSLGQRLNGSLHKDGEVVMEAPFGLKSYTTATLPDATEFEGHTIYVSDGAAGQKFRGSDGTSWVNLG